jgi:hypothetical protein
MDLSLALLGTLRDLITDMGALTGAMTGSITDDQLTEGLGLPG